uniref:CHK kinase-like domain-containing protein n=1 Tax=Graphocephala atropunctata TaxID=36148 RepID=A0A1B6MNW4_9HEMI
MMGEPATEWLTIDFLTQCLQREEDFQNIEVTDFTTSRALPLGEQYLSCPLRVKVHYKIRDSGQSHSISLIIKSELKTNHTQEYVASFECTESTFYTAFIPKANALIKSTFAPRSFYSPNPSIVVLEDLKDKGFVMGDKVKRLDFEHCRSYISAITTLHAVSFAVHREDPALIESFKKEKVFSNDMPASATFKMMSTAALRCLAEYTETSETFKKHSKVIRKILPNFWDMVVEAVKSVGELKTLNHADSWTNNFMFRYNEDGSIAEIKLLDFQMVRYASPVIDLVYFIWSSVSDDVRRHRLDELYHLYVDQLNTNLKRAGCKENVSYELVKKEVEKLSPLALNLVTGMAPFTSENSVQELEPFFVNGSEEMTYKTYKAYFSKEKFRNGFLPKVLEQMEAAGVFDYFEKTYK